MVLIGDQFPAFLVIRHLPFANVYKIDRSFEPNEN